MEQAVWTSCGQCLGLNKRYGFYMDSVLDDTNGMGLMWAVFWWNRWYGRYVTDLCLKQVVWTLCDSVVFGTGGIDVMWTVSRTEHTYGHYVTVPWMEQAGLTSCGKCLGWNSWYGHFVNSVLDGTGGMDILWTASRLKQAVWTLCVLDGVYG
ncbi:hypothetical protein PoB_000683500 [Plakobranchus ocellatus]|uniref:Uncharacterized protein n=1 Tax=Plakobranchus ocellatus TaxID=259542 RepID=A0AAV3YBA6_9GAST|nr:hypothetical protein PoB_000683500 [Plakobranchus ocellatus]